MRQRETTQRQLQLLMRPDQGALYCSSKLSHDPSAIIYGSLQERSLLFYAVCHSLC
jgi:hypothetical protein